MSRLAFGGYKGTTTVAAGKDVFLSFTRPQKDLFEAQLNLVIGRQVDRDARAAEILTQVTPQFAYWSAICGFNPSRHARTLELIFLLLHCSMLITQRMKHELATPRPVEYSVLVQPMIQTPAYFAWPSGHATEAYVFANLMRLLRPNTNQDKQLQALANRIADNRVIAGLHFPIDSVAGYVLADGYVSFIAQLVGKSSDSLSSRVCDGSKVLSNQRNYIHALDDSLYQTGWITKGKPEFVLKQSDMLMWLWKQAETELKY